MREEMMSMMCLWVGGEEEEDDEEDILRSARSDLMESVLKRNIPRGQVALASLSKVRCHLCAI